MYENFFALSKAPFSVAVDPECIHLTAQHTDVIGGLAFGVLERKGYMMLTGEAGLGKTTAIAALLQVLMESNALASVIFTPTLSSSEFLDLAMLNFGFKDVPGSKARTLKMLEEFLIKADAKGRVVALIVDEAHRLSPDLLEEVRLLGNFESGGSKLLQIVLVGQNQLSTQLNLPELWQLKQRIALRLSLRRLDRDAVEEYVRFRWRNAGGEPFPFGAAAMDAIASWSNGVPRLINVICDNALLIAFSNSERNVDAEMVFEACEELALPRPAASENRRSLDEPKPTQMPAGTLAVPAVTTVPPEEHANGSAPVRPSRLKTWFGMGARAKPVRSRTGILLLKEP